MTKLYCSIMDKLFDLEEELVLFFANNMDDFHHIGDIYHHAFFEKLSKVSAWITIHEDGCILLEIRL